MRRSFVNISPAHARSPKAQTSDWTVHDRRSGALLHIGQTAVNNCWSNWISHGTPATFFLISLPVIDPNADGRLELFTRGADGALWHIWQTAANNGWSGHPTAGAMD